ncbi:hypothetical protein [Desulfoluna sp.]|uniref:hypothetical protein n=1 Tax=Desulfoluna sp. TaxID=2045199 RepID=UPI00261BD0A6|nr:hypothetical protein [Desulfoluna sp.]
MADEKRYSVEEAAKELKTGVSTLLLWQHIYSEFLTRPGDEGEPALTREDILLFTYISECTESGLTQEEIRQALRNRASGQGPLFSRNAFRQDEDDDILSLLDEENPTPSLLARLVIQQRRLAEAEERKASAMERRLSIEEEKARSLSAILTALQTSGIPLAASAPAAPLPPKRTAEPIPAAPIKDPAKRETPPTEKPTLDDLSALVNEPLQDENIDDLSALVEAPTEEPLDDLWSLVEENTVPPEDGGDNLWDLVEKPPEEDLDNLWALVDETPEEGGAAELDDLWALVENTPTTSDKTPMSDTGLDDLWAVADEPPSPRPTPTEPMGQKKPAETDSEQDNLWDLVETPPTEPAPNDETLQSAPSKASEPDRPFPSDPAAYKDYILKEIIGMKRREELSAAQVAVRLNKESKPTFSGKGLWESRTIDGIFRIIEKAGPRD